MKGLDDGGENKEGEQQTEMRLGENPQSPDSEISIAKSQESLPLGADLFLDHARSPF